MAITIGLREAKRARTREAISEVATRLFMAHGFENVTVAQIAAAAEVSVKTVFNYFPAKEDLFFDRAAELIDGLVRAVRERPEGVSVAEALRRLLDENLQPFAGMGWAPLRDPSRYEEMRAFIATEQASPALRARRLLLSRAWIDPLAEAIADALGVPAGAPVARAYAAMALAALDLRQQALASAMLERRSPRTVERRVRATVAEAFGRIARAFSDVDPGGQEPAASR